MTCTCKRAAFARVDLLNTLLDTPQRLWPIACRCLCMAKANRLPKAFQGDTWDDEDEYEEEGTNLLKNRQSKAAVLGMIKVGDVNWTMEVRRKISEITGMNWSGSQAADIDDAIQKASKATCSVQRGCNSQERTDHHKGLAREAEIEEKKAEEEQDAEKKEKMMKKKEYHEKKARNKGLGVGTGLLLYPQSPLGYLVITNNHIIMNKEEAKGAQVVFDYLIDDSKECIRMYGVRQLFAWSPLTKSAEDQATLDFSVLVLEAQRNDPYLEDRSIMFEETARIQPISQENLKRFVGVKALPLIMFSHPLNLAMRVSVGPYPDKLEHYPVGHVEHCLPTDMGSSGANLLFSSADDKSFTVWKGAFVHFRHGCAVAWQSIGPLLRDSFYQEAKKKERKS